MSGKPSIRSISPLPRHLARWTGRRDIKSEILLWHSNKRMEREGEEVYSESERSYGRNMKRGNDDNLPTTTTTLASAIIRL
jgi:hypothetical protein